MNEKIKMLIKNSNEQWRISLCGEFKERIMKQLIEDDIPQLAADKIFYNAANILSNCPNPYKQEMNGKTRNSNRKSTKWKNI